MKRVISILLLLSIVTIANAQECFPNKPNPPKAVNDFAGILSESEQASLESSLRAFEDTTSIAIVIAVVTDLCDMDKASYSYQLFEKWGIGNKEKNNGVLIMVKPKEIDGRGEVFIETGYGMEGVLPDAIAKRIVENEIIPNFKNKDYYGGIANAAQTVMEISAGEYSADEYAKGAGLKSLLPFLFVIVIIIIIMVMKGKQTSKYASTNGLGFWAALALLNASSRSHGGSFGNFGSGGGGFGGFGGGSSGGGGAGGSW